MNQVSTSALSDHIAALRQAVIRIDLTPAQVRWHYIHLAYHTNGRNAARTAAALGVHLRTVQRVLAKSQPSRGEADNG